MAKLKFEKKFNFFRKKAFFSKINQPGTKTDLWEKNFDKSMLVPV